MLCYNVLYIMIIIMILIMIMMITIIIIVIIILTLILIIYHFPSRILFPSLLALALPHPFPLPLLLPLPLPHPLPLLLPLPLLHPLPLPISLFLSLSGIALDLAAREQRSFADARGADWPYLYRGFSFYMGFLFIRDSPGKSIYQ